MDLVEDSTELSAGVYFFTPAESTGRSSVSTLCQSAPHMVHVITTVTKLLCTTTCNGLMQGPRLVVWL